MGMTHFSILNTHPEVRFIAVCDSLGLALKNIKKYMALEVFDDYRAMIDTCNLDFVVIATPTGMHADAVRYATERNIHVFVEKPFVLKSVDGQSLADVVASRGLINQVGYVLRFSDVFQEVRRHLNDGMLGDLVSFRMEMAGPTILKDAKSSWRSKKTEGGGCLYDFASHGIDMINYTIGPPDRVCGSVLQRIHSESVEDSVRSTFLYTGGPVGSLYVNWSDPSYRKPAYRFEIIGRTGKLIADLHAYKVFLRDDSVDGLFKKGWNTRYVTDFAKPVRFYVRGNEFTRQLDHFVDCILGRCGENISPFSQGLKADLVIEQIIADAGEAGNL